MSLLLLDLGYSEGAPPAIGPCAGAIPVSSRLPWTAYQRTEAGEQR
jgi:hypothetical protein